MVKYDTVIYVFLYADLTMKRLQTDPAGQGLGLVFSEKREN